MPPSQDKFPFTINLTCIIYGGGPKSPEKGPNGQLWYSCVVAYPPENPEASPSENPVASSPENPFIDGVTADECYTTVSFWEPNADRRPIDRCLAVIIGEAAFLPKDPSDPGSSDKVLKIQGIQVSVLPNTAGEENKHNHPHYSSPTIAFIGRAGTGKTHNNGFRSFEVTCCVYNAEDKANPHQFVVRCFFDSSGRWLKYPAPSPGSLVYIVGAWIGKFAVEGKEGQFQPAILATGAYSNLTSNIRASIYSPARLALLGCTPTKEIPKFAPHGYSSPTPLPPSTPRSLSRTFNAPESPTQHRSVKLEYSDLGRETMSDSETESCDTLPQSTSIDNNHTDNSPSLQGRVLGAAAVQRHTYISVHDNTEAGSRKRRRV